MSAPTDHDESAAYEDLDPGPEDAILERAWAALDEGEPEKALLELEELDIDWPERWIPEAIGRTELAQLKRARQVLDQTLDFEGLQDHPDFLWAEGQLCLREWRIEAGCKALEKLALIERTSSALERLSLCAELDGDFDKADRLLAEAAELDSSFVVPTRMSQDEFAEVIERALDDLPAQFRHALETIEVAVEPVPAAWMVDMDDASETPPDILGLFVGTSELERSDLETGGLPPRIFLFQRNLERAAADKDELIREIRTTLFHEVAHLLGFDERGVEDMGLA